MFPEKDIFPEVGVFQRSAAVLRLCLGISILCGMLGCKGTQPAPRPHPAPPKPAVKIAPPTPLDEKKQQLGGLTWDPAWDVFLERSLPPQLFSARAARAVRGFCPRFPQETPVNKRAFWAYFFQALAAAEAGLDPSADVHHTEAAVATIDPVTHRPTRQEGLLQLTYQDGRRYGCAFDWPRDRRLPATDPDRSILRPRNNLACGIKIVANQVITQHKPLVSPTSYWSTLRPGTPSYRVFAKQMENVPAACGVGVLKPRTQRRDRSRPAR
jgi:hypothetical protein